MIGWGVEWPIIMVVAHILHAATYGAHHIAAMMVVHQFFRGRHQAKGQAIYTSIAYGIGGAIGAISSGYTWDLLGADMTFFVSSAASFIGLILVAWKMKSVSQ